MRISNVSQKLYCLDGRAAGVALPAFPVPSILLTSSLKTPLRLLSALKPAPSRLCACRGYGTRTLQKARPVVNANHCGFHYGPGEHARSQIVNLEGGAPPQILQELFSRHNLLPCASSALAHCQVLAAHFMCSISLGEVRIAGSLLATLIQVVGQRAGRRAEGLLLGDALVHTVAVTDDTQVARERTDMQLDVTGYVSTDQKDAFYEPLTGTMNATKIAEATSEVNRRHVSLLES